MWRVFHKECVELKKGVLDIDSLFHPLFIKVSRFHKSMNKKVAIRSHANLHTVVLVMLAICVEKDFIYLKK